VAFDMKIAKHPEQDGLAICEFSEKLPFSIANAHKQE